MRALVIPASSMRQTPGVRVGLRVTVVRTGMVVLAMLNLWWGVWALLWPRHFFDTFPGLGFHWTSAYPPYNEHLVVDLGAIFLTLAFLLAVGAAQRQRAVRLVVLAGVFVFNSLHLAFHGVHRGDLGRLDYALSTAALVAGVLAPLLLLVLDRPVRPDRPSRADTP